MRVKLVHNYVCSHTFSYITGSMRLMSRNIALLEDKELATDLTHDRQ